MTRSRSWRPTLGAVAIALSLLSESARAQDVKQEARAHFDRGLQLVDSKRFEEAAAEFEHAQSLRPHPSVLYNLGMAQAAARRLALALATLQAYLASDDAKQNVARAREVRARVAELETKVGHLELNLQPAQALVRVDGRLHTGEGSIAMDPGAHTLLVTASNHSPQEQAFVIREGESKALSIQLRPDPSETPAADAPAPLQVEAVARSSSSTPASSNTHEAPRAARARDAETPRAGKTEPWVLVTMAGTGVLLAATTVGLVVDNSARYSQWQDEEDAITAERKGMPLDAALTERQRLNHQRADRIKLQDELAVGVGVASGFVLAATVVWWLLDPKVSSRNVALRTSSNGALLVGSFQ